MHQIEPESKQIASDDDSLYPYVNNDIKYGLFEDIVDSYYLDSQIKDNFQCDHDCYSQHRDLTNDNYSNACTHDYHHITQSIQDLTDSTQQNTLHSMEENTLSFTDDTDTHCDFNITDHFLDTENANDKHTCTIPVPVIVLYLCHVLVPNLNSTKLHLQGVAPRSQYSDPMLEAVTLHQFAPIIIYKAISQ